MVLHNRQNNLEHFFGQEKILNKAAKYLTEHVKKLHPTDIINTNGKPVAKVPVTVDGTWMRRGHNSKQGVVLIMSVHTGGKKSFLSRMSIS